ncbi:transposase [Succinimonas sp.]|uniref:transposase n=1 Tax=Succinimonas sp. TaxID=1936151 RepID=UPI00386EB000
MPHVYRERPAIPIPVDAYVNHSDARVYLIDAVTRKRTVIGVAASDTAMHPNDTYRKLYPDLWAEFYSEYHDRNKQVARVGMYGLCLGASCQNGLYETLLEAYGAEMANLIMDASMYAIMDCLDEEPRLFPDRMENQVLFSPDVFRAADLAETAAGSITEEMQAGFRERWIRKCAEKGLKEVWLIAAAPDHDCFCGGSRIPESSCAAHPENPLPGCIYAVSAAAGEPVSYFVNPDGKADAETFRKIIDSLKEYGVDVAGVILDSGFYAPDTVKALKKLKLDYVMALPEDSREYRNVLESRGDELFFNPEFLIEGLLEKPVNRMNLYGVSQEAPGRSKKPGGKSISLYYSSEIGLLRGQDFNMALSAAKEQAEEDAARGKEPIIPAKFRAYLESVKNPDGSFSVNCNFEAWRQALKDRGFFALLSSRDFGPRKTYELYALRSPAEEQYQILRALEGFTAAAEETGTASDADKAQTTMLKYAICFASAALRHAIMTACRNRRQDPNDMIREMDEIRLLSLENREYMFIRSMSPEAKNLLEEFSMKPESFDAIARDYSRRERESVKNPVHTLPDMGMIGKRKRGRQPGSKNKATLAREAAIAEAKARGEYEEEPKRKKGRPFGSKDSAPRKVRSDSGVKRGPRKNES